MIVDQKSIKTEITLFIYFLKSNVIMEEDKVLDRTQKLDVHRLQKYVN